MSVKQFAENMKSSVEKAKSDGITSIPCENIIAYLNEVLKSTDSPPANTGLPQEAYIQKWIEEVKHWHQSNLEMFRSVITAGQGAIKSIFLLNGGATVALLAFISHLIKVDGKVAEFSYCLLLFSLGALMAALISGCTYLSQWFFATPKVGHQTTGYVLNIVCIVLGVGSYGLFFWGLLVAYFAFNSYG